MKHKRKKILFIITYLEMGGAQRHVYDIIKNLDREKYSIHLISSKDGYLFSEFLKLDGVNFYFVKELCRKIRPLADIVSFCRIYFYVKKYKFNIVHLHSPKASFLGRWAAYLAGVKNIIYTVHGWPFHDFMNKAAYFLYYYIEKISALITTKIIVVSRHDLVKGIEGRIASKDKFSLIHYGIDAGKFKNIYLLRKSHPPSKPVITTVSCLKKQKGLLSFLEISKKVLKEIPEACFFIIGDGPLRGRIKNTIENMGLENKVTLNGWVPDPAELYEKTSVFILTSLWEGLPVASIEAIICGIPTILTDTKGIRDIAGDLEYVKVVGIGDNEEAAKLCVKILKNYHLWDKIIHKYINYIDIGYWSAERLLKEMTSLYQNM
ncbi:MAG: glycosyltransferase [Candidatus Omnitrophica bacterium]|nr:glycosyltransferase [Candidatus Omnitrophota bacterium]MBD3269336.1 glycosyltransferase [Candidatus Omnitrophota bacterium]